MGVCLATMDVVFDNSGGMFFHCLSVAYLEQLSAAFIDCFKSFNPTLLLCVRYLRATESSVDYCMDCLTALGGTKDVKRRVWLSG